MAVVTLEQVQQWLETSKLELVDFDPELELTAERLTFSALASQYTVSGWVSTATTPSLVQEIVAMLTAAYTYRRAYSEDSETDSWYAAWLETQAKTLVEGLVSGTLTLTDAPIGGDTTSEAGSPSYFPDDAATSLSAINPFDPAGAVRAFTMYDNF